MKAVDRRTVDLSGYPELVEDTGFLRFAPPQPARGGMFSARGRAKYVGEPLKQPPLAEEDLPS